MNNEIKISVSISLPGRIMLTQEQAEASENKKSGSGFNFFSMEVSDSKGENRQLISVKTRKTVPASQSLNISKDGYDAMTDKETVPYWSKEGTWKGMNAKMRLEAHLRRICEGLGGTSYTYQVFED